MSRKFNRKIECYDCHQYVWNLREHRDSCKFSRQAKSAVKKSNGHRGEKRKRKAQIVQGTKDVYFLLDVSGSMSGTRLDQAKVGLSEIEKDMAENDRIAVVTFDTKAFFKLKPRPIEQIRRQQEMEPLLKRIFANGMTAIWDAIYMAVSQVRDKTRKTIMVVLTDGEDNSSSHTYQECLKLIANYPAISLSIIHVGNQQNPEYAKISTGDYIVIEETKITITVETVFRKYYLTN